MRKITGLLLVSIAVMALGACGLPPAQLVVIISPTPNPNEVVITVTPAGEVPPAATAETPASGAAQPATSTPTPAQVTEPLVTPPAGTQPVVTEPLVTQPVVTATFAATPTLSAFPTETRAQILIAQQDFQRGFMFWISTSNPKVIWVLINSADNPNAGEWRVYTDDFQDGEPEFDPNISPPDGLYQPRRGFGKLWRNTNGLRDALGFATTPEFALNTTYVYQPGGYLDANGTYVIGPGKHFLTTLSRQTFAMIEAAPPEKPRWEKVG